MKKLVMFMILTGTVMWTSCAEVTPQPDPILTSETDNRTILFLCPHGAAKSVMAGAYFQKMVTEEGLNFQVTSAGTEPDAETAPAVVALLKSEGIDVSGQTPRLVTREELASAYRVISMGCDVSDMITEDRPVEHWDDVPSPSEELANTSRIIHNHVEQLVLELKASEQDPS